MSGQQRFKALLIRDKQWLGELYLSTNLLQSKRILNFATDTKLDTLIRYFHFLSNGAIKIKAASFESVRKSHISFIKKQFERKTVNSLTSLHGTQVKQTYFEKFVLRICEGVTEPWWLSGLEHQSNSRPMLKGPEFNPPSAREL